MTRYLSPDQIVLINGVVGGAGAGVRDIALVEAAAARPGADPFGYDVFASVTDKAAALLHSLASTQGFLDGNKRTAWTACRTFLELNGRHLREIPPIAGEVFVLAVAVNLLSVERAAEWLDLHLVPVRAGNNRHFTGQVVRLPDLFVANSQLAGYRFEDCELRGPAVLIADGGSMEDCEWIAARGSVESVVWEIDPAREAVVGAVGFVDSAFVRCRFKGVGYGGTPDAIANFFATSTV